MHDVLLHTRTGSRFTGGVKCAAGFISIRCERPTAFNPARVITTYVYGETEYLAQDRIADANLKHVSHGVASDRTNFCIVYLLSMSEQYDG